MQGFRLTQEAISSGFSGGTVKVSDAGHLFNVGQALMEEDPETGQPTLNLGKIIVVDDDLLGEILSGYPALERVASEAVPGDVDPVRSPVVHASIAVVGPYTPQTNKDVPGQPVIDTTPGFPAISQTNEIPSGMPAADLVSPVHAEHADEPDTVEGALAAGERVSGLSNDDPNQEGDAQTQDSEATGSDAAEND